jgi:hypothetical protein
MGEQRHFTAVTGLRPPLQFFRIGDNMLRELLQEIVQRIGWYCFPEGLKQGLIKQFHR